ncbi:MAG: DUF1302 family protein [Pseudomonadota bacterium]
MGISGIPGRHTMQLAAIAHVLAGSMLPYASLAQDFELADDMFDQAEAPSSTPSDASGSWTDRLTVELGHQVLGHLNRNRQTTPGEILQQAHGLEINRLSADLRYQELYDNGWLLRATGRIRAYLPGGYEHDNTARPDHETWLDELYLQRSGSDHSVTLGRQTIVWGETVGNSVLDIINTTEYRDLTVIDLEDARRNQWMVNWDWFSDAGTISGFVNLYPEFNPLPVVGSPLFPELPWRLSTARRDEALFETGVRWQHSLPGSDLAIMAAWLYENDVSYEPPAGGETDARPLFNDHLLLGFSGNRAIGRLLLTLDIAYSRDVLAAYAPVTENAPALPRYRHTDRLATSAGLEYALTTTRQLSFSIAAERFSGARNVAGNLRLVEADTRGNLLLRYSQRHLNDDLVLSATLQTELDGDLSLANLTADWRINNDWSLGTQLIVTRAEHDSLFPGLDEDVRLGTRLSFSF